MIRAVLTLVASLVVLFPPAAGADTQEAMEAYFDGEKLGGLTLVGMGAVGLGAGAVLATRDSDFAKGAGYSALGMGVVHAAAGVFVYVSSNGRIDKFTKEISEDAVGFRERESKRMAGVRTQFLALKITWGVLIVGGGAAAVILARRDNDTAAGVSAGLAIEAAATLLFDIVADRRAKRYLDQLKNVTVLHQPEQTSLVFTTRF